MGRNSIINDTIPSDDILEGLIVQIKTTRV